MKKFALALMATAFVIFGFGGVANAYPPAGSQITVSDTSPAAGSTVTITVDCGAGSSDSDTVTATINGTSTTGTCTNGTASVDVVVPSTPGNVTVTVTNADGDTVGSVVLGVSGDAPPATVPSGGLPATGSDGIGTTSGIAIGLLVVGIGLFAVATVRRRQPTPA